MRLHFQHAQCADCAGKGYQPVSDTQLTPCPKCIGSGIIMKEGPAERFIFSVLVCLDRERKFPGCKGLHRQIHDCWFAGMTPQQAVAHILLENQRGWAHNPSDVRATDGSAQEPSE